jgi:hypothetical protein
MTEYVGREGKTCHLYKKILNIFPIYLIFIQCDGYVCCLMEKLSLFYVVIGLHPIQFTEWGFLMDVWLLFHV